MSASSVKDALKQLQPYFAAPKTPLSLPPECRRMLESFVAKCGEDFDEDDTNRANEELKTFYEKHIKEHPKKYGAFGGVLKEFGPILASSPSIWEWYTLVFKPVFNNIGYGKAEVQDAHNFVADAMAFEGADSKEDPLAKASRKIRKDLITIYLSRSRSLDDTESLAAPDNIQIAQQIEDVLLVFGRKHSRALFRSLSDFLPRASTRLQTLSLLSAFLRLDVPRKYHITETPLLDQLLTCLLNDTSRTVLTVALSCLIMLLPSIPAAIGSHLPRIYLIYSRLLCWERSDPANTDAQKRLMIDERYTFEDSEDADFPGVGSTPDWDKALPPEGVTETASPDLATYFTFLYGLYPINFMSYIRKPRRFLKDASFPGAEDFELSQAVIRSRSDRFRQRHILHSNFMNMTLEDEVKDPKWFKSDPADLPADCHALCIDSRETITSPEAAEIAKFPDFPHMPAMAALSRLDQSGRSSPVPSYTSLRSGTEWRDAQALGLVAPAAAESSSSSSKPVPSTEADATPDSLRPRSKASISSLHAVPEFDDLPRAGPSSTTRSISKPVTSDASASNLAFLQQERARLKSALDFEQWHKEQYSQHISQMTGRNVKIATAEAETLNLINQNRSLKAQLDQARKAREATIKDSAVTRRQAGLLEANLVEKFAKMKTEQETWMADGEELSRLREEIKQYRELLVASEKRAVEKGLELDIVKKEVEELAKVRGQLQEARRRIHGYENGGSHDATTDLEKENSNDEHESLRQTIPVPVEKGANQSEVSAERDTDLES